MSAANAPFDILHIEENLNNNKKDKFVSFEVPIDPKDTNGLKVTTKFLILESSNAEDVLYSPHFDDLVLSLNVAESGARYRLMPTLFEHGHKKIWTEIVDCITSDDKDKIQDPR